VSQRVVIHTRDDLLNFLSSSVHRRSMHRALNEGNVEVLGGFSRIPPRDESGWCVRASSPDSYYWYEFGVTAGQGGIYRVWNLTPNGGIPWKYYVGWQPAYQYNVLMTGDDPGYYLERMRHEQDATTEEEGERGCQRGGQGELDQGA
jgi:hypothetical protein